MEGKEEKLSVDKGRGDGGEGRETKDKRVRGKSG